MRNWAVEHNMAAFSELPLLYAGRESGHTRLGVGSGTRGGVIHDIFTLINIFSFHTCSKS